MSTASLEPLITKKYALLSQHLDERTRRSWAAAEAAAIGAGGISIVHRATGLARTTIEQGLRDLETGNPPEANPEGRPRVRAAGGGRKRTVDKDATLLSDLDVLISPAVAGASLRWTGKSVRTLAVELQSKGHVISYRIVAELLKGMGYTMQCHTGTRESGTAEERNLQFQYLAGQSDRMLAAGLPVISIRAQRLKMPAAEGEKWEEKSPNEETAEIAAESIRHWWEKAGRIAFPHARQMMITTSEFCRSAASCGVWLTGLQRFADESGLSLAISYMPRGTRKWTCTGQQEVSRTERNTPLQGRVAHEITIEQISAPEQANQVSGARLMPVKRSITAPAKGKECRMGWNHTLTPGRVSAAEAGAR